MRVEVHRITAIVENDDTFVAQIFVKLAFKGMANDKHLTRLNPDVKGATLNTPYFPLDKDCNPTFKPNAAWYLEQLVFDNMAAPPCEQLRQRDAKVKKIDDDLVLEIYTEGKFYEKYELQDFPFDAQDLTFHLTLNVQVDGKLGMDLDIDDGITRYISQDGFMLADRWSNRGLIGMPILCYALQFDPQGTSDDDISSTPRRVLKVGTEAKKAFQAENKQRQFASWSRSENKQRVSSSENKQPSSSSGREETRPASALGSGVDATVDAIAKKLVQPLGAMSKAVETELGLDEQSMPLMTSENQKLVRKFPTAYFTLKVQRRYRYYLWNVMLPTFIFPILCMLQFSLNDDYATRLECSLGLVLTIVLFKFAVVSPANFPTVNYLTLLDQQVLLTLVLVSLMAIENGLAAWLKVHYLAQASRAASAAAATTADNSSGEATPPPPNPQLIFLQLPDGQWPPSAICDYWMSWCFALWWVLQVCAMPSTRRPTLPTHPLARGAARQVLFFLMKFRNAMRHGTKLEDIRKQAIMEGLREDATVDSKRSCNNSNDSGIMKARRSGNRSSTGAIDLLAKATSHEYAFARIRMTRKIPSTGSPAVAHSDDHATSSASPDRGCEN